MVVAVLALSAMTAGCGDDGDDAAAKAPTWRSVYGGTYGTGPDDVVVEIRADGYHPETVRVPAGGRVTWINVGTARATAENFGQGVPKFDTHTVYRGQAKSVVFERPGRDSYFSSYDSETFSGNLVVQPRRGGSGAR